MDKTLNHMCIAQWKETATAHNGLAVIDVECMQRQKEVSSVFQHGLQEWMSHIDK